jgi:hypothetical protein
MALSCETLSLSLSLSTSYPLTSHSPCGWSWCESEELKATYGSLLHQISSLEENIPSEDRLLYLYAATELHCTVATLSSFKESSTYFASLGTNGADSNSGEPERQEVMSLWQLGLFSVSLLLLIPRLSSCSSSRIFLRQQECGLLRRWVIPCDDPKYGSV